MISLGLALIVIAIIIFVVVAIWYGVSSNAQNSNTLPYILAIAFALLIIGVIFGSWSLMSRGVAYNHEGHPGILGVHAPFASGGC